MNKIGLITIHDTINWGSLAQTYGLYHSLKTLGMDVDVIDYNCEKISRTERTLKLSDSRSIKELIFSILYHKNLIKKKDGYNKFLYEKMTLSKKYNINTIKEADVLYDAFIVGSDIVWGVDITGYDYTYFLDFSNKNKYSYSSSVGDKWPDSEESKIKDYLNKFDNISVREHEASEWIGKLLSKKIPVTCDPSMLFDSNFWRVFAERPAKVPDNYILCYRDADLDDALRYAERYNLPVYDVKYYGRHKKGVKWIMPMSFGEWLWLIDNAHTIFTGSYHGMLFSLYFNKPFFFYLNQRSGRLKTIASECNIEHRTGNKKNIDDNISINYGNVNSILEQKRTFSWDYLQDIVNKMRLL